MWIGSAVVVFVTDDAGNTYHMISDEKRRFGGFSTRQRFTAIGTHVGAGSQITVAIDVGFDPWWKVMFRKLFKREG